MREERKSDLIFIIGYLLILIPVCFLIVSMAPYMNWSIVAVGTVIFFTGVFVKAYAHEYAKSLPQCGTIHLKNIKK